VTNNLNLSLSEEDFIYPSLLKDNFAEYRILSWKLGGVQHVCNLALGSLKQEDCVFKGNLEYIVRRKTNKNN
jgi:hypothetical protein